MAKEIYISTTPHETRLAIVEDEQLAEIYYERENEYTLAGSIYNGKVTRVLPGMQSSFVDIGLERDAFLYVTDFMEEQGDADFESDSTSRTPASREESRSEGRGERRNRSDREKRGRDRNLPASTETADTQSFDEPIAPHPIELSAAEPAGEDSAAEGQGSRRWRGRRGRRRGRSFREGEASSQSQVASSESERPSAYQTQETFVLEGSSVEAEQSLESIETQDVEDYQEEPPSEADAAYALRRSTRREEIRRGRTRDDAAQTTEPVESAPSPHVAIESASAQTPFLLPGESIRKYRDPAEVAKEEEVRTASLPTRPVAVAAPSFEVVGWDGGAVLPGETLSRRRRGITESSAAQPQVSVQAERESAVSHPEMPVEAAGQDQAPIPETLPDRRDQTTHAEEANVEQVNFSSPEMEVSGPLAATNEGKEQAEQEIPPAPTREYEPTEGESASFGETSRRDLRRLEQRAEPQSVPELQAGTSALEELAPAPDATTYDLTSAKTEPSADEPAVRTVGSSPSVLESGEEHSYTTLQASGEMVSEPSHEMPDPEEHHPASQDSIETHAIELAAEAPVEAAFEDAALDTASQVHAYGEGDLEEEELEGDEYEYDLTLAAVEEEELDEYEEETLDDTADLGSVLHEMAADEHAVPVDDVDGAEYVSEAEGNDFTVEDFGGEPEETSEPSSSEAVPQEKRRGRQDSRRFGRERRSGGGFRGGSGGDRGRGRQSVQTMDLPAINELLKPGQEILVQIAKEPIAKKGARITSHIALPGRFLVFMPTVNHTGVSRKISSDEERRRLKSILLSEKGEAQGGFIVRTAAEGASEEELRNDLRFLIQLWQDIKMRSESSKSPALIYHDLSLVERILRDQVTDNFSAIWVDTETEYERVLRFLQRFQPSLVRRVKLYTKETPLFEHFGVTQEIDKALKSKVWLKSGGSIVINQTEALVAIDINTGKYVGKTARLEDTILKTNLDAIPEIVRQIRLRDLGGIIVIDFIDMDERKNRGKVMQALEDELKSDRAPSKVLPFNDFGLVIMTRKRVKQSLERTLCIPDPVTEGTGMIKSPITVANEIYIEMRKMYRHIEKTDVMLRVHPEVVKQLKASGGKRLQELEEMTHKTILVKSDPALNPEQFDIH